MAGVYTLIWITKYNKIKRIKNFDVDGDCLFAMQCWIREKVGFKGDYDYDSIENEERNCILYIDALLMHRFVDKTDHDRIEMFFTKFK